jgi:hypothetical protein
MASKGLFSSPLVDTLIAADVGSNLMQSKKVADQMAIQPDEQTLRFANQANLTGNMAYELPRQPGLFSSIAEGLGMGNTVTARPKDIQAQQAALTAKLKEQEESMGKIANWRNTLGATDTQAMLNTPVGQRLLWDATGTNKIDLSAPTSKEQAADSLNKYRMFQEKESAARLSLANQERIDRINMFNKSLAFRTPQYKAEVAAAETAARVTTAAGIKATNWDAWTDANKGWQIINKETFKPIDRKGITPRDALNDTVNNRLVNPKQYDTAQQVKSTLDQIHALNNLVDTLFIDTRGMDPATAATAIKANWAKNKGKEQYDLDRQKWDSVNATAIAYIKNLQGRYPTTTELNAVLKGGTFPDFWKNGRVVAHQKLKDLERNIRMGAGMGMDQDENEYINSSASSDYSNYMYGGGTTESEASTEPAFGSSVVPEATPAPAGLGEVERSASEEAGSTP